MMKKLRYLITFILTAVSMNAFAAETIKIVWPFGTGNNYTSLLLN